MYRTQLRDGQLPRDQRCVNWLPACPFDRESIWPSEESRDRPALPGLRRSIAQKRSSQPTVRAFELTNAAAKRRLPNEQDLARPPKAPMVRRRNGISQLLQVESRCSTREWPASQFGVKFHALRVAFVKLEIAEQINRSRNHAMQKLSLNKDAPISRATKATERILFRRILAWQPPRPTQTSKAFKMVCASIQRSIIALSAGNGLA